MASKERKSIISAEWNTATQAITFGVAGIGQIVLDLTKCLATAEKAMYHGYEQKVRDAAAIPRDTKTGASATPQEKFDAMKEVVENLHEGVWNVKGSREAALNRAALFEAIGVARGKASAEVESKLRDKPDDVLRAYLVHGDIAAEYARRTARDSARANELIAQLDAMLE